MVPMATIVPSKQHPDEEVRFALGGSKAFTLSTGGSYESDDREQIALAIEHPWLDVKPGDAEAAVAVYGRETLASKDDVLSAENSVAFDPEAIKRDREAVLGVDEDRTAIDAGLRQRTVRRTADVALTRAADVADDEKAEEKS